MTALHEDLRSRLSGLTIEDEHRLGRRLDGTRRTRDTDARARQVAAIEADVARAEERIARRRAAVPVLSYPEDLPVSARRDDIARTLEDLVASALEWSELSDDEDAQSIYEDLADLYERVSGPLEDTDDELAE